MYHDHHWETTKNQNNVETSKQKSPNWDWVSDLEYIQLNNETSKDFPNKFCDV